MIDQTALRMLPAYLRLEHLNGTICNPDDRLIVMEQLISVHSLRQIIFKAAAEQRFIGQITRIEAELPPPAILC